MRSLSLSLVAAFTAVVAAPSMARADAPTFSVEDHGDTVEVIATGMTASSAQLSTIRERIEVPLADGADKGEQRFSGGFIKVAETHGSPRVLSIKLAAERPTVRALMAHVTVKQDGNTVHVTIPKAVPVPAPVLPAAAAAETKPVEPQPEAKAEAAAPPTPAPTETKPEPETKPEAATAAAPVTAIAPASTSTSTSTKPPARTSSARSSNPLMSTPILAGLGVLALVFAAYIRRKRKQAGPVSTIEVIAQRSLGGKARVVWLTAGDREMVIAVTPQNVRMLGQWKKGIAATGTDGVAPARVVNVSRSDTGTFRAYEPVPAAANDLAPLAYPRASTQGRPLPVSPAVSGILKLRDRAGTVPPPAMESDDGLDDDAIWARELLAATGGRR